MQWFNDSEYDSHYPVNSNDRAIELLCEGLFRCSLIGGALLSTFWTPCYFVFCMTGDCMIDVKYYGDNCCNFFGGALVAPVPILTTIFCGPMRLFSCNQAHNAASDKTCLCLWGLWAICVVALFLVLIVGIILSVPSMLLSLYIFFKRNQVQIKSF